MKACKKSRNIVSDLLRGSAAIDQMKKEVECYIAMILGIIKSKGLKCCLEMPELKILTYEFGDCKWFLDFSGEELVVVCRITRGWSISNVYSSLKNEVPFRPENVQAVRESLPFLTEAIVDAFPLICGHWQFLIDAANK